MLLEKGLVVISVSGASLLTTSLGERAGCEFLQMIFALADFFKPGLAGEWRPVRKSRNKLRVSGFRNSS